MEGGELFGALFSKKYPFDSGLGPDYDHKL